MHLSDFDYDLPPELIAQGLGGLKNPEFGADGLMYGALMMQAQVVKIDGELVTLEGKASSQQDSEKATLTAGNQYGISKVDNRIEVSSAEPEATFYTVKSGDTLSKIAKSHYGNAMDYPKIFEANREVIKDPDLIYPGQKIRIPPKTW